GSYLKDGGRYNPAGDSWTVAGTNGAPAGRQYATTVWMGSEMIVWGGYGDSGYLNDGGRYNPTENCGKTSPNFGNFDFWLVRLNASGQRLWDASYGGSGVDALSAIAVMDDGG